MFLQGGNSQIQEKLECGWSLRACSIYCCSGFLCQMYIWYCHFYFYMLTLWMLMSSQEILPFVGCCMSPPWVIQHKQWIIPRGQKRKITALVKDTGLLRYSGHFLVQQCHLPDPATKCTSFEKAYCSGLFKTTHLTHRLLATLWHNIAILRVG